MTGGVGAGQDAAARNPCAALRARVRRPCRRGSEGGGERGGEGGEAAITLPHALSHPPACVSTAAVRLFPDSRGHERRKCSAMWTVTLEFL